MMLHSSKSNVIDLCQTYVGIYDTAMLCLSLTKLINIFKSSNSLAKLIVSINAPTSLKHTKLFNLLKK